MRVINDRIVILGWAVWALGATDFAVKDCHYFPPWIMLSESFNHTFLFQTLSFYFPSCGKIPPPVIMVQNVSFRYSSDTVSPVHSLSNSLSLQKTHLHNCVDWAIHFCFSSLVLSYAVICCHIVYV